MHYQFSVASEICRLYRNPESADMDNPMGWVHGERFFVTATNDYGERFAYIGTVKDEAHAERICAIVTKQYQRNALTPNGHPQWQFMNYVYGSNAYFENDGEFGLLDDDEKMYHTR